MQCDDNEYRMEEDMMESPASYEDYMDLLLDKMSLLMSLNPPCNLNEGEEMSGMEEATAESLKRSVRKPIPVIVEENGIIPDTKEDLVVACVTKYVIRGNTVCTRHLMNSLLHRTENARTKQRILDESLQFLKMITLFPEAMRLFLLGLRHEMTVCSQYSLGGYHDRRRRCEGAYSVDYLENCEGASISVVRDTVRSLETLCRYLQDIFSECVDSLKWRLGSAILWFLLTAASPKLPYFHFHLNLASILEANTWKLNKWYEMTNGYSRELLLSPGEFWDSLSQKSVRLSESHFNHFLRELTREGGSINPQTIIIPGIFPEAVMGLANAMRISTILLMIHQFSDYPSRSIHSPAKNADTLYQWTLTDMSNLFVRLSPTYLLHSQVCFSQFMTFFTKMETVLKERIGIWRPFASINSSIPDTDVNMYTCVRKVDPKNIMRSMIATDMLVSAGEGTLASYLSLLLFVIKTRLSVILPWSQYGDSLWEMLRFSPRHQKLALMLFQHIIPRTDYLPPVFEKKELEFPQVVRGAETELLLKNPFLQPPYFPRSLPTDNRKREAFVYYLLHLASHVDSCPAALVGERIPCSLCCFFFPFIYNSMCRSSPVFSLPEREQYIQEVEYTEQKVFVSTCQMYIRPDGHSASYSSLVFAEEVVYLIRAMMQQADWGKLIQRVFRDILETTEQRMAREVNDLELENRDNHGFHVVLRRRSPWFCMVTAVMKVLGAVTPRMYAGSRIRIHEFLMEGDVDGSTLIHTVYQSHGTGTIIEYQRSQGEALVLMDKIDTPRSINCYVFDVVDRIEPPKDSQGLFGVFLHSIQNIMGSLQVNEQALELPSSDMPFFNTNEISLMPSEVQSIVLHLYCVRCIHHLLISNQSLASQLNPQILQKLIHISTRPLPCNTSFNSLIIRQYFNLFMEYLIDTYPGSSRLLPTELQVEEVGETYDEIDLQDCYGVGKEERNEMDEAYGKPHVIRYERRMRVATDLAEKYDLEPDNTYCVLEV